MRIYLLRHGDAPFDQQRGERSLSPLGVSQTKQVVQTAAEELATVEKVVCSPILRAQQTLSVFMEASGYSGAVINSHHLRSEGTLLGVEAYVDRLQVPSVLLLSHQPLIGNIVEYLTDGAVSGWAMTTSALARLEAPAFGRGCAQLEWLRQPD